MKNKPFTGFHHYGIYCPDLEESIAFYRDALGFEFLNYFEDSDEVDCFKMAFLKLDKFLLELSEPATWGSKALEWGTMGPNHFCLVCTDLEALKTKLETKFNVKWVAAEDGRYYKSVLFRGPGNELVELMQVTSCGFPVVHTKCECGCDGKNVLGIGHFGYFCDDLEMSIAFYSDVLGFDLQVAYESTANDLGVPHRAAMLTLNDTMIELAQPIANPIVADKVKCLAYLSMDHLGMVPDGDMLEAMDLIRSRTGSVVWENEAPNITPNVMEGVGMQWALFRGPNGERWEFGKDV